jgi:hypothetical protein
MTTELEHSCAAIERIRATPNRRSIDKDTLEAIIDIHTLNDVVAMLSELCAEKAEHIEENWQDEALAKQWRRFSVALGQVFTKLPRRGRALRTSA